MNDNPVGTPNPLNPAPTAPAAPAPTAPVEPVTPAGPTAPVEPIAAPKKKKTGLIIGLVIGLLALIGGAVAAILIIFVFGNQADAVPAAVTKVLSGEVKDFAISGTITATSSDSIVSGLTVNLDAKINSETMANSITADVNTSISGMDLDFTFDERKVADGDMYIKIDGLTDSIKSVMTSMLDENDIDCDKMDCDTIIDQMMSGSEASQLSLISNIEGEWLHADGNTFSGMSSNITNNETQCLVNALSGASNYNKDIAEIYKQNPFVTYTTENISIAKKKDTIYKLGIDYAKMAAFINAMQNSALANDLLACSGANATRTNVTEDDIKQIFSNFPAVYAEIDGNNNFTRLYFSVEQIGLTADLSITYPSSITVEKPSSSLEMSDYLSDLMESLGGFSSYSTIQVDGSDDDWEMEELEFNW